MNTSVPSTGIVERLKHCAVSNLPSEPRFKAGDVVKVKGIRQTARIQRLCPDLAPGAVRLDRPIQGLRYWNIQELRKA